MSGTVGYTLENDAYKALPSLLKQNYDIIVTNRLKRQYVKDHQDKSIEINIVGPATRREEEIMIIGESKSQLSHNDVDTFLRIENYKDCILAAGIKLSFLHPILVVVFYPYYMQSL